MGLEEIKIKSLGFQKEKFGNVFSFVDFGNVNYWYKFDRKDLDGTDLNQLQKWVISIEKLYKFLASFSDQQRFYYGFNQRQPRSWHISIKAEQCGFIKITKPIQFIKHYLSEEELKKADKPEMLSRDLQGSYIEIPKSNFDVEISVDAIRLSEKYKTICLLSGDSDFAALVKYLKRIGKKIIVIGPGQISHSLKSQADLYVQAQEVKSAIGFIKNTQGNIPWHKGRKKRN
jgi:uncharacterized LabA/DUF88 family protein